MASYAAIREDRPAIHETGEGNILGSVKTLGVGFVLIVAAALGCAGSGVHPVIVGSIPGDDSAAIRRYVATGGPYACQRARIYGESGPNALGCGLRQGDTVWVLYRENNAVGGRILAAGREVAVPIDSIDVVADRIADTLSARYGRDSSCAQGSATIRRWRWWPVGRYTIQLREIDPRSIYPQVKHGRVEEQIVPAEAVVCLTWVQQP
jgi:hypothetical protein